MAVNWLEMQPYHCYFYPRRDCPGWQRGQPCSPMCQRIERTIPEGAADDGRQ